MMTFGHGPAMRRSAAALMVAGMALLLAACGGSGGSTTAMRDDAPVPGNGAGPMIELGKWNALTPGTLDISDANKALRAHYDESGVGRVTAAARVQPVGTETATWNGRWSGRIELNPDPLTVAGLGFFNVDPQSLARLEGEVQVTAYFAGGGVETALTYKDVGVENLQFPEIAFGRVRVTDGRFKFEERRDEQYQATTQFGPTPTTLTGDFSGEGAFGGAEAAGVVGYVGGDVTINYGRGPTNLGDFQSVFYGARDKN